MRSSLLSASTESSAKQQSDTALWVMQAATFCANCNVILARAMQNAGATDELDACEAVCTDLPLQTLHLVL